MKNIMVFISLLFYSIATHAQINTQAPWIWMKGDNTIDQPGVYGIQEVPGSLNKPGARNIASTWRDFSGNLWLLGGMGSGAINTGFLNDLWKFDPVSNKWTWMKGDNEPDVYGVYGNQGMIHPSNKPGGIYSGLSWIDADGKFWLFGGYGYSKSDIGFLDALWKYDPLVNSWTWVSGSDSINHRAHYGIKGIADTANRPGARYCSHSWTDSDGNLWLFGGYGYATDPNTAGPLNDLWKYSVSANTWTWMKGDSVIESVGIYGTRGTGATGNNPGSRYISSSWKDADGNFWLFGGQGYDESQLGILNDLWKYNPVTNQWTWISGAKLTDQAGQYGIRGTESTSNQPGSRYISSSWVDLSGEFWIFGGYGFDGSDIGFLNDFWRFNPVNGNWTWARGDSIIDQPGIYGTQCLPDSSNKSGARMSSISWTDGIGNLWLFGGFGYDSYSSGSLNDLWKVNSLQLILPLKLLSFTGLLNNNTAALSWETEQEKDFDYFTIQRSFDGRTYYSLDRIAAHGQQGNQLYQYSDPDLRNHNWQNVFYRLQMTDKNGQHSYSGILQFRQQTTLSGITLYPNPVQQNLQLNLSRVKTGDILITIFDQSGALVRQQKEQVTTGSLSLFLYAGDLPASTYLIRVTGAGNQFSTRFIKQ